MVKNTMTRDPLPGCSVIKDEIIEFWDTHSVADYDDVMEEVPFDIDIQEETLELAIVPELAEEINRAEKARYVTIETLVNLWLAEKVNAPA